MKKILLLNLLMFVFVLQHFAQVGINTDGTVPDSSAMLDVKSTEKGILIPRMNSTQRNAISTPATGLLVYDSNSHSFWFYNGIGWIELSAKIQSDWNQTNDSLLDFIKNKPSIPRGLYINVLDYGADSSGHTDCTTAIQNALNAISPQGGTVYFPAGKYKTTGGLTINHNVTLLGDGGNFPLDVKGGDIVNDTLGTYIFCTSRTNTLLIVNANGCNFQGIGFINTASFSPTSGAGIFFDNAANFKMTGCVIVGFYDNMEITNGELWFIEGTFFHNPVHYNLKIDSPSNPDAGDATINACTFVAGDASPANIRYESGGGLKINNCKFTTHYLHSPPYHLDASIQNSTGQLNVSNCSFEIFLKAAIQVHPKHGVTFGSVQICNNYFAPYALEAGSAININGVGWGQYYVISNNIFVSHNDTAFRPAIAVDSADRITIRGNVFHWPIKMALTYCTKVDTAGNDSTWIDNGFAAKKQTSKRDTIQSKLLKLQTIPTISMPSNILVPDQNGVVGQSPNLISRGDTTGFGSTVNLGRIVYKTSDGHFYGLSTGSPPVWKKLDN